MGEGIQACVRYLLFFFNLIFALAGLGLVILGGLAEYYMEQYQVHTQIDESLRYIPLSVMVIGAVITIVAFFGCCGSVKESHCMLYTFGVFLVTLFVLEVAAGIAAYVFRNEIDTQVRSHFDNMTQGYYVNPDYRKIMDGIQMDFRCCGSTSPGDYGSNTLPISCCTGVTETDSCPKELAFPQGCFSKLSELTQGLTIILLSVGGGVVLVQLIGIVFSFCLANSIRRGYQIV